MYISKSNLLNQKCKFPHKLALTHSSVSSILETITKEKQNPDTSVVDLT